MEIRTTQYIETASFEQLLKTTEYLRNCNNAYISTDTIQMYEVALEARALSLGIPKHKLSKITSQNYKNHCEEVVECKKGLLGRILNFSQEIG